MELALSVPCDLILMDEKAGRKVATRLGLSLMGTLGLLERADELGLVQDFEATVALLRSTNIRVADSLVRQLLERHRNRISG
jgi:predicted nucleic acid-binding protein